MLARLSGVIEEVTEHRAVIAPRQPSAPGAEPGPRPVAYEVLLPAYLGARLLGREGEGATFHTVQYFESVGQGASFIPRLIGFASPAERRFFELITSVKGLGNRRALRAMAEEPATIARWIAEQDVKALQRLPEIGKRLAETMVVDLREKVEPFVVGGQIEAKGSVIGAGARAGVPSRLPPHAADAVEALVSLGETRSEAERKVGVALQREVATAGAGGDNAPAPETEALIATALSVR